MRRSRTGRSLLAAFTCVGAMALAGSAPAQAQVRAGVGNEDASWHVGASAGQYASDGTFLGDHGADPTTHSYRRAASYGIQSRLEARAIVVEGADGRRVALVKNDLYIPQDLLWRRTAQILESRKGLGIGRENLTMSVSHNHSSPYYSSTAWGAWAFQDVFDVRFYNYYARKMAAAVTEAARNLKPVRVGASVNYFDKTHRHSYGGDLADDGTPAGYPVDDTDHDMTVVRFDDVSDPGDPKPLATLVNFGLHPEFLEGNDLISADYLGPLQRMVDRRTGGLTIFTQSAVGSSEPERSTYHPVSERLEFSHRDYAQAEYGASLMAESIVDAWQDVENETPEHPDRFVPFSENFPVRMIDRWYAGPLSHPYPGVSSCRTDAALGGEPRVPVVGLPDCVDAFEGPRTLADFLGLPDPPPIPNLPIDPGISTDDFQAAGIPVPENYSFPSYSGLEEDVSVHLQAFRLGDILFTVCSCEQFADQSRDIETRTNREQGDQYLGYDWTDPEQRAPDQRGPIARPHCEQQPGGDWICPDPRTLNDPAVPDTNLPPIPDEKIKRMRAQVLNDARGWNDESYLPYAESEPVDTTKIKGNYTHDELPAAFGYRLTVPISMSNDYNGYIVTYREYQQGDHYRKALTGWGPHSSDYFSTRLVAMGGRINGGPGVPREPLAAKVTADLAKNDAEAALLGGIGASQVRAYDALLPNDGGRAGPVSEPEDITRFEAAFFTWNGGSNYTDNPVVRVQRREGSDWVDYADQSGEIPVTLEFPQGEDVPSYLTGSHQWHWTAHFEAFSSDFDTGGPRSTPVGEYRFVVDGRRRQRGAPRRYQVVSDTFRVDRWDGITVPRIAAGGGGDVAFDVGPSRTIEVPRAGGGAPIRSVIGPVDYPDSYKSPARFIREQRTLKRDPAAPNDPSKFEWFCFTCTFRPWADTAEVDCAQGTIVHADGTDETVAAQPSGTEYALAKQLQDGEAALVQPHSIRDENGERNAAASEVVTRGSPSQAVVDRAAELAGRPAECT